MNLLKIVEKEKEKPKVKVKEITQSVSKHRL